MEFLLKGKHEITPRTVNPSKCLYTKLHSDELLSPPLLQGPGAELAINLQLLGWEQFTAQGALWIINLASKMGTWRTGNEASANS